MHLHFRRQFIWEVKYEATLDSSTHNRMLLRPYWDQLPCSIFPSQCVGSRTCSFSETKKRLCCVWRLLEPCLRRREDIHEKGFKWILPPLKIGTFLLKGGKAFIICVKGSLQLSIQNLPRSQNKQNNQWGVIARNKNRAGWKETVKKKDMKLGVILPCNVNVHKAIWVQLSFCAGHETDCFWRLKKMKGPLRCKWQPHF